MPWVPSTDFEEEVVNLQPDHDFIYGVLSEPEYNYPRPKAHIEYAAKRKSEDDDLKKGRMNGKMHVIKQVQRMANTKPLGEQPTLDDWENNEKVEQETVGMMRYCGLGVSVDQPLSQQVTIASYPVENTIKLVQNGRRKVALYFDDNVFKLKEKVSDTSSSFDSCNTTDFNECHKSAIDTSLGGDLECSSNTETSCNNSFVSSSSLSCSFSTAEGINNSFASAKPNKTSKLFSTQLEAEDVLQYEKLLEDTTTLSLNSSTGSRKENIDSFQNAEEMPTWKPITELKNNVFEKQEVWPVLSKKSRATNKNNKHNKEQLPKKTGESDTTDDMSNDVTISSNSSKTNFLDRFIKTEKCDTSDTVSDSTASEISPQEPITYATVAKPAKSPNKSISKMKGKGNSSSGMITDFQPFYTTRRIYALKRSGK